jgi:hypothetical protein
MPPERSEGSQAENAKPQARSQSRGQTISVKRDDSDMTSSYANVCNVSSSREEVVLNFSVHKAWERTVGEVQVKLESRVILSPFAATRLPLLRSQVRHHGSRHSAEDGVRDGERVLAGNDGHSQGARWPLYALLS